MRVSTVYPTRSSVVMLYQVLQIILCFVTIFYCVNGENVSRKTDKRTGVELQMCIKSFNIHNNKIIRTEDSREMGAKYINEIDLDSRNECLRLCCETEQCDVFVFDEKRPGSCYLFHCGPPDDFKCKFTNHANYTSAVLIENINSQSTAELEEQIRRTQQDHELESLRKLADNSPPKYSVAEPVTVPAITEAPKVIISTTALPTKPACSRNQFECRTSGDCIAIYNVCDGIPQCADGSDEAAELGCPTEKPSIPPPAVAMEQHPLPAPANSIKYQQTVDHHKPYKPDYGPPEKDSRVWQPPPHQLIPQQDGAQYPQVGIPQPQGNLATQRYQWEYQPLYEQNKGAYNSINSFRGRNNVNSYEPEQSHIFNHKGPGVIGEDGDGGTYIDQTRQYAPYYPSERVNWQEVHPPQPPSISPTQHGSPVLLKIQPVVTAQSPPCKTNGKEEKSGEIIISDHPKKLSVIGKSSLIPKKSQSGGESESESQSQSGAAESVNSKETNMEHYNTVHTDKPHKHKEPKISVEHQNEDKTNHVTMERLQYTNDDRDFKPRGAVISLALGLTTTALMAALIACRLRVVRRRGRRGHGPYAHDADYLVNGMYL